MTWVKGQSGNPLGRPKSAFVTQALRAQIAEISGRKDQTLADLLARRLIKIGLEGKDNTAVSAITEIRDSTEGKPVQSVRMGIGLDDNTARILADLASRLLPPTIEGEIIGESGTKALSEGLNDE